MPRVRMLVGIAGSGRDPGDVLDLPGNEAQALVARQHAELVRGETVETPERPVRERATRKSVRRTDERSDAG